MTTMRYVPSTMLRRKTNAVLAMAEKEPILITRYGKPDYVLMSVEHYKAIAGVDLKTPNTSSQR